MNVGLTSRSRAHTPQSSRLVLDALRPGTTSLGCLLPVLVTLILGAVLAAVLAQVVVPWTIYPAL